MNVEARDLVDIFKCKTRVERFNKILVAIAVAAGIVTGVYFVTC